MLCMLCAQWSYFDRWSKFLRPCFAINSIEIKFIVPSQIKIDVSIQNENLVSFWTDLKIWSTHLSHCKISSQCIMYRQLVLTLSNLRWRNGRAVAFALRTQLSQVRIWLLEKRTQDFFREPAVLRLRGKKARSFTWIASIHYLRN